MGATYFERRCLRWTVLTLLVTQVLAALSFLGIVVGFAVGHSLQQPSRTPRRVRAKRDPGRWTEALWVGGSLLSAFWSVGVLLMPAYAYHWPPFPDFPFSSEVQLLGFFLSLGGGVLFFAATRTLGRHMTVAIQVQEGHRLVQEGPYRRIRHPLYTGILTGGIGLSVLFLSPLLATDVVVLVGLAFYRARLEEALLASPEGLGAEYKAYMARTGRFLPRLRSKS